MAGGAAAQTVWARPLSSFLLTALPFIRIQMREPMHRSISSEGARWRADIVGGGKRGAAGEGTPCERKTGGEQVISLSLSRSLCGFPTLAPPRLHAHQCPAPSSWRRAWSPCPPRRRRPRCVREGGEAGDARLLRTKNPCPHAGRVSPSHAPPSLSLSLAPSTQPLLLFRSVDAPVAMGGGGGDGYAVSSW